MFFLFSQSQNQAGNQEGNQEGSDSICLSEADSIIKESWRHWLG